MEGLSGSGLHVAVECVVDAAVGADNALLKVGGKLGAVVIYESYEVEALLMILSEFENFGFEAFEGSLIELACLRGEVDIELAADGVGHEMAAVEALVRRQRMTAEATLVTGMPGGGGDAEGGDGAFELDVKEIGESGAGSAGFDLDDVGPWIGEGIIIAPERNQAPGEVCEDAGALAGGGDGTICVFSDHKYQRVGIRIWNSCLAHD